MFLGDILLLFWMWGVSIHVWRLHDIDFIRLLNLQNTELDGLRYPERVIYREASDITLVFLFVFIIFNKTIRGVFNIEGNVALAHVLPILLSIYFVCKVIFPFEKRKKWLWMFVQVLLAPGYVVTFRCGYIGDLLTSLVRVMISMSFSIAYFMITLFSLGNFYSSHSLGVNHGEKILEWWNYNGVIQFVLIPFLTLLPLWLRLMQCLRRSVETGNRFPHMANGLKYASAISVIAFGTFNHDIRRNKLWIASFIIATLYQFTWDLTMDWGIVVWASSPEASNSLKFCGLAIREKRAFPALWMYLLSIIGNLFLRFAWTLTLLSPDLSQRSQSVSSILFYHLGPIIAAAEVMRRMVWGFFRLEYEQLEVFGLPEHAISKSNMNIEIDKVSNTIPGTL